ncbi:MAG: 2OG-Fe(II) oxygenase family protein [Pseudomonadota bacterium]
MQVATVRFSAADAPQRFVQALRDTGFAILEDHPINAGRLEALTRDWQGFFDSEAKHEFLHPPGPEARSGYWSATESETAVGHEQPDLKEFFQFLGNSAAPADLTSGIAQFRADALAIGIQLLRWIDAAILQAGIRTLKRPLAELVCDDESVLRVLHYPPLAGGEPVGAVRAAAHEDINLITLLPVTREPGLEALDREGVWHAVHGKPGQIIVNAGDMLQEATDRYFPSTTHRVVNPSAESSNRSRISIPYFLQPELDTRLSDRYTAGSYLAERLEAIANPAPDVATGTTP